MPFETVEVCPVLRNVHICARFLLRLVEVASFATWGVCLLDWADPPTKTVDEVESFLVLFGAIPYALLNQVALAPGLS